MLVTPADFVRDAITPALAALPTRFDTPNARAEMLAIALQESGLRARRQAERGPARSFYQFEISGVRQVLMHPACTQHAARYIASINASDLSPEQLLELLAEDDVTASVFARLLLLPDPAPLPNRGQWQAGWDYYIRCWHPGMPRPATWPDNFAAGWRIAA